MRISLMGIQEIGPGVEEIMEHFYSKKGGASSSSKKLEDLQFLTTGRLDTLDHGGGWSQ